MAIAVSSAGASAALAAEETGPSIGLDPGQVLSGTAQFAVTSSGATSVQVEGTSLEVVDPAVGTRVLFDASSYDRSRDYQLFVNDVEVAMPKIDVGPGGGSTAWGPLESGVIPAGVLQAGANSFRFVPGPNGNGVPDRVYLRNVRLVLGTGEAVLDPVTASDTKVDIGYDRPLYEFEYPFVIDVPAATLATKSVSWDTTTVSDGRHTIVATDASGTASVEVEVSNTTIELGLTEGQIVSGVVHLPLSGPRPTQVTVDGEDLPVTMAPPGGAVRVDLASVEGTTTEYRVFVNDVPMTVLAQNFAASNGGASFIADVDYATFPAGVLNPGTNTVRFEAGIRSGGTLDSSYLRNLRLALEDGTVVADPGTVDVRKNISTTSPTYVATIEVPETANTEYAGYHWDTTGLADGPHTVTVHNGDAAVSVTVLVDNTTVELSLSLEDGQRVAGSVAIGATGASPLTVSVDGAELEPTQVPLGARLIAEASSYDVSWDYKLFINDVEIPMPKISIASAGAGSSWGELVSGEIPPGTLQPGANELRFVPGPNGSGVPDRVYLRNVKLALDSGADFADPTSVDTVINIGYGRPTYEFEYPFTITVPGTALSDLAYVWDSTSADDGEHTVSATDRTGTISRTVVVDNTGPQITVAAPLEGAQYLDAPVTVEVSAHDAGDDASVPVVLTLNGDPIENGLVIDPETFPSGSHTLVASAVDSLGNRSEVTTSFATYAAMPYAPVEPAPADGAVDQPTDGTKLGVTVSDPTGDDLTVTFRRAENSDFSTAGGQRATHGLSADGAPARGAGTEFTQAEYDALHAADGLTFDTQGEGGYPYQQFEITVADAHARSQFDVSWSGQGREGHRLVLSVWNYDTDAWQEIDAAVAGADALNLKGHAAVADSVRDGVATLMVQELPAYIAPSEDGVTNFAWITDTQYYAASHAAGFEKLTQWVADHQDEDKIAYTIHTGDIVDTATNEAQWINADKAMRILDEAGAPYGVVPGNHDVGGGYALYRKYFGEERFAGNEWYGDTVSDNVQHYDYVSTPEADYLFLYLTWRATAAEWQWVKDVIAAHPDANVILGTHEQFEAMSPGLGTPTHLLGQGQRFMEEIIEPFPNVVAILSGHKQTSYVWVQRLEDGRIVLQVQSNYQHVDNQYSTSGGGFMRYLKLDANNETFTSETFSAYDPTITHAWAEMGCESLTEIPDESIEMTEACQEAENFIRNMSIQKAERSISTDYVGTTVRTAHTIAEVEGVASGSRVEVDAPALAPESTVLWYVDVTDGDGNTRTSDVWSFTTAASPVTPVVVSGSVSGAVGPVAGACVYLYESLDAPGAVFASCSNADGSFWIGDVVPGSYVVAVADPSGVHATYWGDAPVVVDAGSAALELVLTPIAEGTVSGVVTGAAGPVSGACVYLYADASDQGAVYATCTGPDGGYWLSGVAAGEYTVAVADWSGAHATYWAETVTTVAPGAGVTVDVTLVAVASGGGALPPDLGHGV